MEEDPTRAMADHSGPKTFPELGEPLSDFEKKLIIGGLVIGLFLPVLDAAFAGARALGKAGRAADDLIVAGGKSIDDVGAVGVKSIDDAPGVGRKLIDDAPSLGGKNAPEVAQAARKVDSKGAVPHRTTADHAPNSCKANSFTGDTLILTDDGLVPIEDVELGDYVLAEDPETGEQEYQEVVYLTDHPEDELVYVTVEVDEDGDGDDDTDNDANSDTIAVIEVTHNHPIYVEGIGWLNAVNLNIGDELRRADGGTATVLAVEQRQLDESEPVYNFTVDGFHTYFVDGTAEVLVHNCGGPSVADDVDPNARQKVTKGLNKLEVKDACLQCNVEFDDLGRERTRFIDQLISTSYKKGKSSALLDKLHLERPKFKFSSDPRQLVAR